MVEDRDTGCISSGVAPAEAFLSLIRVRVVREQGDGGCASRGVLLAGQAGSSPGQAGQDWGAHLVVVRSPPEGRSSAPRQPSDHHRNQPTRPPNLRRMHSPDRWDRELPTGARRIRQRTRRVIARIDLSGLSTSQQPCALTLGSLLKGTAGEVTSSRPWSPRPWANLSGSP
jgi:hypothetical protein